METPVKPNEFAAMVIQDFIQNRPEYYQEMVDTNHFSVPYGYFPNYHVGESVWTHTMMVMSHTLAKLEKCEYVKPEEYKEIILAILLHDIGKPDTFEYAHDRQKITFYGHEQMSTVRAVGILRDYVDNGLIDDEQMICVLTLINQHTLFYDLNVEDVYGKNAKSYRKLIRKIDPDIIRQLLFLRVVDMLGNISTKREVNPELFDDVHLANKLYQDALEEYTDEFIDSNLPTVTLMVGLPGSGKSYYMKHYNEIVLSRDAIVEELAPDMTYTEAFRNVDQKEVDRIFEVRLNYVVQKRTSFTIDKTNLTRKSRNKITNRLKGKYNIKNVVMLTSFETILDRNIDREMYGKRIPDDVIDRFAKMYTLPQADEGLTIFVMGE